MQKKELDCLSPEAQKLAEARLAAKRAARAEAREIRMKELERQQKEASDEDERMSVGSRGSLRVEERPEKDFTEKGSRNMPSLSAATLASLGGTSSRRGSGDTSISVDTEASIREIKDSLAEVEEKYKKAMVSNAQLDNEKTNFMYQVDTLKDALLELEEQLAESRRQYEEKNKEFERQKHAHSVLQFQFAEAKEALKQRDEMLAKHGIILNSEVTTNGEPLDNRSNMSHLGSPKVSQEETNALKSSNDGTLGRVKEVKVASENVDKVGESAVWQNPEREQPRALPPDGSAQAEASPPPQDRATVPEALATDPGQEPPPTHVPETRAVPGNSNKQVGDQARAEPPRFLEASVEANHHPDGLKSHDVAQDQESAGSPPYPGEVLSQDGRSSAEAQNRKKEGKPEEESSRKSDQESDPAGSPSPERTGAALEGPNESLSESLLEGEEAEGKKHLDTKAGREGSKDGAVISDKKCTNLTQGDQNKEEETLGISEGEKKEEEQMQTMPSSPKLESGQPEKTARTGPTGAGECSRPSVPAAAGRDDQKGELCETSSRKSKNKKRKNKKRKSPPVDSPEDVKKELVFQNTEEDEEEEVRDPAQDALAKVAHDGKQEARTELDEYVDCPEEANADSDDKPNLEVDKAKKPQEAPELGRDTAHPWGADGEGWSSPSGAPRAESPEEESAEHSQTSRLEKEASAGGGPENKADMLVPEESSHPETTEENCERSDEQTETAEEAVESRDSDEPEDPAGSSGAESKDDVRGRASRGKDKNKEECAMS